MTEKKREEIIHYFDEAFATFMLEQDIRLASGENGFLPFHIISDVLIKLKKQILQMEN